MTRATDRHRSWPADRLYWAVVDARENLGLTRTAAAEALSYRVEPLIPQNLDELQLVWMRVRRKGFVVCAGDRAAIEAYVAETGASTLVPDSIPDVVGSRCIALEMEGVAPERFNLLTGALEPTAVARWRTMSRRVVAIAALIWLVIVCLAIDRRRHVVESEQLQLDQSTVAFVEDTLRGLPSSQVLPPLLRLDAELRSLRQTRTRSIPTEDDAVPVLAALLSQWPPPEEVRLEAETLHVQHDAAHVVARVHSSAQVQELAGRLARVDGFEIDQPSVQSAGNMFRTTVRLERTKP